MLDRPEGRGCPLRRLVFAICIAAWALRVLFLCIPDPLSIDEVSALTASEYGTASQFVATSNWAERWDLANHFRQWHILWIVPHALWGYVLPSNGQMAYGLTFLTALVAMAALAGAARHLYGDRGFLLCLLVTSLSPLFLNYTVRALGTMPAVMWLCLALYLLTAPGWTIGRWSGAGLCLGLAFGTSFGAGVPILAIASGLAVSLLRTLREESLPLGEKVRRCLVCPLLGLLAALVPLAAVEAAARYAGGVYADFLRHHTMLEVTAWLGPPGLWLREMFELDPLLEVAALVGTAYAVRDLSLTRGRRVALGVGAVAVVTLLLVSTAEAAPRAVVSLALFAAVGMTVCAGRLLERRWAQARALEADVPRAAPATTPFGEGALVPALLAVLLVLTSARSLGNMPRLAFPAWPLLVLGLLGLLLRGLSDFYPALVRGTAVLGSVLLLVGAGATLHAKSAHARARAYAVQHPYLQQLTYQDFWSNAAIAQNLARLRRRASPDVAIIGPLTTLYPASCYEEDPYKILLFRNALRAFGVGDVFTAEEIIWASVFFEAGDGEPGRLPPPGTPDVPDRVEVMDAGGKPAPPRIHPYRGIELRFPRWRQTGPIEMEATLVLPADPDGEDIFGFEYLALAPYVAADVQLTVAVFQGDRPLQTTNVPIVGSRGKQADALLSLYDPPQPEPDPFQLFQCPLRPAARREEMRIVARLATAPGTSSPPVSLYIRRPFIHHR